MKKRTEREILIGSYGPLLADNFRDADFTQEIIEELLGQFNDRTAALTLCNQDQVETLYNQMLRENGLGHIVDNQEMGGTVTDIKVAQKRGKSIELSSIFSKNRREGD